MKLLYESERIEYFKEICMKYGRPVDFKFDGDRRTYFFSNGLVVIVKEQDGRYIVEESKASLLEIFRKGEFARIAVVYSFATSIIAVFSAVLEAYTGLGSYVFTTGLLASSLTVLAATLHNMQKAKT